MDIHLSSRPLPSKNRDWAIDTAKQATVAAGATAAASYAFHRFGYPKLSHAGSMRATRGTAIAMGLATALLAATNNSGALHGGKKSNSAIESTILGVAMFGAVGWHPAFHGKTVSNAAGARFNVLLGLVAAPVIHQIVAPD